MVTSWPAACRELPGFEQVLLVALTGYGQEDDRRRALQAGFDDHLTKPVRCASLEKLLADPKVVGPCALPSVDGAHMTARVPVPVPSLEGA